MRTTIATLALIGAGTISSPALAGQYDTAASSQYSEYATVVSVEPIRRTVRVSTPRRECWEEPVTHYSKPSYGGGQSYTPLILGGIVGGVLGNRLGKGTGNTIMTAAGAILGSSVGRDVGNHHRNHRGYGNTYTTNETRCKTTHSYRDEERHDGYRVEYEYNGRVHSTVMDRHPGDRIRVNVDVSPTY